jgi:hypothetical protein
VVINTSRLSAIFWRKSGSGNREFWNVFLDLCLFLLGEAHCCQVIRGTDFNLFCWRLHNLIVAAMASSIYIIGILVSEDKKHSYFLSANAL